MTQQIPLDEADRATEEIFHGMRGVGRDISYLRLILVNCVFVGDSNGEWVLVDAGIPGSAARIMSAAYEWFGHKRPPTAIILTHGHFDHAGSLEALLKVWNVPVYAHPLEFPYLNGGAAYPPPDPTVGGGVLAALAGIFPRGPYDFSRWLRALPEDRKISELPGWQWIHTPGHCPGHISLWRPLDRTLIAGDAVITTAQESAYAVAMQEPEMHGPPKYFTQNWEEAGNSVRTLAALEPELLVSGHGRAMQGSKMRLALHILASTFSDVAVPKRGRYVVSPTDVASGSAYDRKGSEAMD